ncbi:MAG: hypothetical protein JWR77_379, partial [Rhizorhabdus sp.]|nr:hypothetical protein [Rhizorhabdus sp.]
GEHWDKLPVPFPLSLEKRPTTEDVFEAMCAGSRVPLDEVKRHPHGKVYDELDLTVLPRAADCDAMLQIADPTMIAELAIVLAKDGDTAVPSAEYPLLLTPRRANEMMNSIGRNNGKLAARRAYNPAFLHPSTMALYDVMPGDVIRISSQHGEVEGVAEPETRLRPGTLSMSGCFGTNPDEANDAQGQGACTSRLMDANAEYDPIFGQPKMGAIPVCIAPIRASVGLPQ